MVDYSAGLPATARIGPFDIELHVVRHLPNPEGEKTFGQFVESEQAIYVLRSASSPEAAAETVLHELLHAMFAVHHLQPDDTEERLVSTFATALAQFWRDNPEAIEWINSRLTEKKNNDAGHKRERIEGR